MAEYTIERSGNSIDFDDAGRFMDAVELMLRLGERFAVSIARTAVGIVGELNALFAHHGLRVELTADSDPTATDYLIAAGVGVGAGAAAGAIGGAGLWLALRIIGAVVAPELAPFLLVGSVAGGLLGGTTAMAVTHWGLRVRVAPIDAEVLQLQLAPLA